jgi:hypothetical protein
MGLHVVYLISVATCCKSVRKGIAIDQSGEGEAENLNDRFRYRKGLKIREKNCCDERKMCYYYENSATTDG